MARAVISEREPAGGGLDRVRLLVDAELSATHTRHGQYIEIRHDGTTRSDSEESTIASATRGFFAIASAPGERTWDVLVKDGGSMSDRLRDLPLGAPVIVSEATGEGFPVERAHGHPLIVAVTGSGIAAVLSTIGARIDDGDALRTFILYGVRDRSEIAIPSELEAMRSAGIDVAICLSREHSDEPGFFKGYVQDVVHERGWQLATGMIFAAGNEAMIDGMRRAAPGLGLRRDDVRVNS
jgi:NAD(P)H-flavin reductase